MWKLEEELIIIILNCKHYLQFPNFSAIVMLLLLATRVDILYRNLISKLIVPVKTLKKFD